MKSYKVYRKLKDNTHVLVHEWIGKDRADSLATELQLETGDTCYVVEYRTSRHHPHRNRRNTLAT